MLKFIKNVGKNKWYKSHFYLTEKNDYFNIIINSFYIIKLIIDYFLIFLINIDIFIKSILRRNNFFLKKDKNNSDTCFVVGSGPSIKGDLKFLKGKDTFVSNDFFRHEDCNYIEPKYYCYLDGGTFNPTLNGEKVSKKNPIIKEIYDNLSIYSNKRSKNLKKTTFLLPFQQSFESVNKFKFFPIDQVKFIKMLSFDIADYIPKRLEISSGTPFSFNIVPWKICIAILMGYKKIILLGCEQDFYLNNSHFIKVINDEYHLNLRLRDKNHDKNDLSDKQNLKPGTSNYIGIMNTLNMLKCHMNLKKFSEEKNCKVINCTPGGIIDIYETDNIKQYY